MPSATTIKGAPLAGAGIPCETLWPRVSLSQLTADPVGSLAFVDAAAAAGFRSIGLRLTAAPGASVAASRLTTDDLATLRQRLRDCGVCAHLATGLWVLPESEPLHFAPTLDVAASLGVETMLVVVNDDHTGRALECFAKTCALAAARNIAVGLEFMAYTSLRSLAAAADFVAAAKAPNAALIIDALHLARSGGTPADVAALPPRSIALAQLCDAPLVSPPREALRHEARNARRLPGEGELPLFALMDALPPGTWLDIEAPSVQPGTPTEKASRAAAATARLIAQHAALQASRLAVSETQ